MACECKFYSAEYTVDKKYASHLRERRANFIKKTKTKKLVFNTMITNYPIKENEHSLDVVDSRIVVSQLM